MSGVENVPEVTFQWHRLWLVLTGLLAPAAFILGWVHKRRHGPTPLPTQLKRVGLASAIFLLLLMLAARFS
jgi:hypothetical protein